MEYLIGGIYGLIHLIASIIALTTGTFVLITRKGTKRHKQIGYIYIGSMGILILTAFMIYRLFNGWGIFHYAAVLSLCTITLGMIPIWTKKPKKKWKYFHFSFMYWSVIGLYAAFISEVLTRIPETPFFGILGIATGGTILIAGIVFAKRKAKWIKVFEMKNKKVKHQQCIA